MQHDADILEAKIASQELVDYPFLDNPVEVYKLNNEHTIVLAKKEGDLVNVSTWARTGSINEDDKITGISHFLEHLMFKGTPTHKAGDFDRILEAKGAVVNAATWKDYTFYYVTLPKGENNEHLIEAIDLHADMMLNPIIPQEEIGPVFDINNPNVAEKRERYVVIEEIRMRNDQPWTKTYNELNHNMYSSHPYRRDVIGTADVIATVSRETIMDYYTKWYTPGNLTTIVVGDFDSKEILKVLIEKFKFQQELPTLKNEFESEKEQTAIKYIEKTGNINTGFMMLGYVGPKASDLKSSIGLDILSIILGEGKSSRLNQNLIEKPEEPIFNIVGADQYHFRDSNNFFVQGNFSPDKKEDAVEQFKEQIQLLTDNKVEEIEFKKAKKKLKVRFANGAETVSEIGENIGFYITVCRDLSMSREYLEVLDTITIDDVHKIAKEYLDLNKVTISVLVPENNE